MRVFRLLFIAVLIILSGCASTPGVSEADVTRELVTELGDDSQRATNQASAETLYNVARKFLKAGSASRALKAYDKIRSRFPFSEYATQAALESIYAHYFLGEYQAALAASSRFLKQHPRHPQVAYVYYLRGLANSKRTGGESLFSAGRNKRDPTHLRQAFTDFNLLIHNYPDSPYVKDAQLRMIKIRHRLAKYELNVAEYYLGREAWVAASRRAEHLIENYQGTNSVPRALEILAYSYRKLGLQKLALDARAVLQTSFPNYLVHRKEFYRQRAGLKPRYELPPMDGRDTQSDATTQSGTESDEANKNTAVSADGVTLPQPIGSYKSPYTAVIG